MKVYDNDNLESTIEAIYEHGRYTLEINGHFYCTCESMAEVNEEVIDIVQLMGLSFFRHV